jgi:hypothetical protein
MATLIQQYQKAQKLTPEKIVKDLFDFIKTIEKEILETNKKQLLRGKDTDNKPLISNKTGRGTYSAYTELITQGKKKEGENYTLFDTGDWQNNFFLDIDNERALFGSRDYKTASLILEFGEVFGLTDNALKLKIRKDFLPFVQRNMRKGLGIS